MGSGTPSAKLPRAFLTTVFVVNLLAFLNFVGVFVAMVAMTQALKVSTAMTLQLPVALYVAVACAAPATPWLLTRIGVRRLLVASIVGMSVTTAAASVMDGFWPLLGMLFLHGLFCAPISPATQAAVSERLEAKDVGLGMAIWGAGNYACYLVGPMLIGWLVTDFGWRSFLLLPLPFALLALPMVIATMPRQPVEKARGDAASLMLAPLVLFLLLAATSMGPALGWFQSPLMVAAIAGFGIVAPLFAWLYSRTPEPRFDLGALRDGFAAPALLIVLVYNLVNTGLFEVEFLGQESRASAELLGVRSTVSGAAMLVGFAAAAWLAKKQQFGQMLIWGFVLTVIGKAGYLLYTTHTGLFAALWPVAIGSFGFSLVTGALAAIAYRKATAVTAAQIATAFILAIYVGASLGGGILEEVYMAADTMLMLEHESKAEATLNAFYIEFWVELVITVLLIVPTLRLLRRDNAFRRAAAQAA